MQSYLTSGCLVSSQVNKANFHWVPVREDGGLSPCDHLEEPSGKMLAQWVDDDGGGVMFCLSRREVKDGCCSLNLFIIKGIDSANL